LSKEYDLVVLGGGPGGYVAAIRASQLGMNVAVVEKEKLGGTCLHKGCIPTKSLLKSASVYQKLLHAESFGIDSSEATINFSAVQSRKETIVNQLHEGVQALMNKGKIDVFYGHGRILGPSIFSPMPGTISIEHGSNEENTMIVPKNVLIATGSHPISLESLPIDHVYTLTSDDILQLEALPASVTIVGGGVIGVEWASMLADFGVHVTIVEYAKHLLPTMDRDISRAIEQSFKQKGIIIYTESEVKSRTINEADESITLTATTTTEDEQLITSEKVLVSVGRRPNTSHLGIENTSIETTNDYIVTNDYYQTKESHIYAIGDVIGGMELAHVASHEGIVAVEHMANAQPITINKNEVPACVYSNPEIATVGLTEAEARDEGFDVSVGKFPFQANGKALINGDKEGFVKIITDKRTNDLLGVHMIGSNVTELISEASLATFLDATPWEISKSIHPHPSLSEVVGEAALAVENIHIHG